MSSSRVQVETLVGDTTVPYERWDSPGAPIPTYKCWSVFSILCCCLPLGLVAVFYSGEVEEQLAKRNLIRAKSASRTSRIFNIIALICGLAAYGYLIYYIVKIYSVFEINPTRVPVIIG